MIDVQPWVAPIRLVYRQESGFSAMETTHYYAVIRQVTRGESRVSVHSGKVKPGSTAANQLRRRPQLHPHWTEWSRGIYRIYSPTKPFLSVKYLLL